MCKAEIFWDYYMSIENDLYKTIEYVEPCEDNYNTYSQEYAKIINIACAEADVIFKELCRLIDANCKPERINDYKKIILEKFPHIEEATLRIDRSKIVVRPFEDWKNKGILFWWKNYQKIKHERMAHYPEANLKNAIYAVGALRILELYYLRINATDKYKLANKNGPFFSSAYTNTVLYLSENTDLPDFLFSCGNEKGI